MESAALASGAPRQLRLGIPFPGVDRPASRLERWCYVDVDPETLGDPGTDPPRAAFSRLFFLVRDGNTRVKVIPESAREVSARLLQSARRDYESLTGPYLALRQALHHRRNSLIDRLEEELESRFRRALEGKAVFRVEVPARVAPSDLFAALGPLCERGRLD